MVEFGKLNKVIILPSDPNELLKDLPFEIGEKWSGKRVRNRDVFVELGGYKARAAGELVEFTEEIHVLEDGKIEIWGPDIDELDEGAAYSFIEVVTIAGERLNKVTPGFLERNISIYHDFIEGIMHLNMRNLIRIRLHRSLAKRGILFEHIARGLMAQLRKDIPQIQKMEIKFFIEPAQTPNHTLRILNDDCLYIWNERNLEALKLKDKDTDLFFGCRGCRYYFPNHACILTPDNYGTCGVINWADANASIELDPFRTFFEIPKGNKIDDFYGNYSGINSKIFEFTNKNVKEINLYSTIKNPQTSCGTFEALVFYIPYVDGLGIAEYYYRGETPLEIKFSTVINIYNRDLQKTGYRGIALTSLMDEKFMQADGGWKRVAWINNNLKEKIAKYIPKELMNKIATEKQARSGAILKEWVKKVNHPLKYKKWDGYKWT